MVCTLGLRDPGTCPKEFPMIAIWIVLALFAGSDIAVELARTPAAEPPATVEAAP